MSDRIDRRQKSQKDKAKDPSTPGADGAYNMKRSLLSRIFRAIIQVRKFRFGKNKHRTSSPHGSGTTKDVAIDPAVSIPHITPAPSLAETYSSLMSTHRHGYPLYHPEPERSLPVNNRRTGIRIGDVGVITRDGSFDFLFNIFAEHNDVNERGLPENFEVINSVDISITDHFPVGTHLLGNDVTRAKHPDGSTSYTCPTAPGAVLELPEGATLFEARDSISFRRLAALHAESWYKYMAVTRGRDAPNGSLYLITGCIKTKAWGNAVFDRPSTSEDHLQFITQGKVQGTRPKYSWNKAGSVLAKIGPSGKNMIPDSDELINQCVFLRGYRIMLRQDRWDVIKKTRTVSSQERTSADPQLITRNSWNYNIIRGLLPINRTRHESGSTTVNDTFSVATLVHPSDVVNAKLLEMNPRTKIALTHDHQWCQTVPDKFTFDRSGLKAEELFKKVTESFETAIEEDCVFLTGLHPFHDGPTSSAD